MSKLVFCMVLVLVGGMVYRLLTDLFESFQYKDKIRRKNFFCRYRYELTLVFKDGNIGTYCFYANYKEYQANDFLIDLFKENRFVGIEIEGTIYHYTYDQIVQIGLRKQRLRS
ncbi:hypothetical protein [Enterococcus hirae]|uniref:hypothetical protein n=1 Tax=Enterococcus hirae TaxID=1354 RepID=UPI0039A6814B